MNYAYLLSAHMHAMRQVRVQASGLFEPLLVGISITKLLSHERVRTYATDAANQPSGVASGQPTHMRARRRIRTE